LEISDIPSTDDVKIPIIAFFQKASTTNNSTSYDETDLLGTETPSIASKRSLRRLLIAQLRKRGFKIYEMGVVWKDGICVEHCESDKRVALIIDNVSEMYQDWLRSYRQQQKIEGVGWKCFRVDVLSFLSNFNGTMHSIFEFLGEAGILIDNGRIATTKDNEVAAIETLVTQGTDLSKPCTDVDIGDKRREGALDTGNKSTTNAGRTKRARKNQTIAVNQFSDLNDVVEAEMESLLSIDSQSNTNDGNVVVDLSFLQA
jgi:hypothetical protein